MKKLFDVCTVQFVNDEPMKVNNYFAADSFDQCYQLVEQRRGDGDLLYINQVSEFVEILA